MRLEPSDAHMHELAIRMLSSAGVGFMDGSVPGSDHSIAPVRTLHECIIDLIKSFSQMARLMRCAGPRV